MSPLERTASNKSVLMRTDLSKNERCCVKKLGEQWLVLMAARLRG
jgi:hypothetical protein